VTGISIELFKTLLYDVARYNIYLLKLAESTHTLEDAKQEFPYHGIISNFGNIIELRSYHLYDKFEYTEYMLYVSFVLLLISCVMLTFMWKDFRINPLFNNEFKKRRIHIQSLIVFFGTLSKSIGVLEVSSYINNNNAYIYDIVPLGITFVLIMASKHVLRLQYRIYSLICPLVSLGCTMVILYSPINVPNYILKGFYAIFQTMHFTIFDTTRLMLYIAHDNKLIAFYCAYDTLWIGIAKAIVYSSRNYRQYLLLCSNLIWFILALYSKKYYIKDNERLECIAQLENS
tara:strand:+ start:5463 stop:6326 length:864 start_codon:yes stop_codon:yes gene_type:complete